MSNYLGIVIKQSLKNASAIKSNIIARKNVHNWLFYLVSVEESAFHSHIKALQDSMVTDDEWYAHYFRDEELIVVFRDATFYATIYPDSWETVVNYGRNLGIPLEQLDFKPRTKSDTAAFFNIQL